jgi:hypothetical protein
MENGKSKRPEQSGPASFSPCPLLIEESKENRNQEDVKAF